MLIRTIQILQTGGLFQVEVEVLEWLEFSENGDRIEYSRIFIDDFSG
jgi:hypothetical protein